MAKKKFKLNVLGGLANVFFILILFVIIGGLTGKGDFFTIFKSTEGIVGLIIILPIAFIRASIHDYLGV